MTNRNRNLIPHLPSTTDGVLRKADALQVRKVVSTTPSPFVKQRPTLNTQWTFRVNNAIVVDNAKMPSNMDFTSMVMLRVPANDTPEVSE